ncbi:hypothetical protein [Mycolicibacterium goodii]|uniref:hypothetical protein n=1 Tax=Mycolicibacterium goodii TaxID=134601 RepID=UPI0039906DA7
MQRFDAEILGLPVLYRFENHAGFGHYHLFGTGAPDPGDDAFTPLGFRTRRPVRSGPGCSPTTPPCG